MKTNVLSTLVGLVVALYAVGAKAETKLKPNTITPAQVEAIVKRAYNSNPEARLCINYYNEQMYEAALGYCYSWSYQALDVEEIAVARETVNLSGQMIRLGIHHERQ